MTAEDLALDFIALLVKEESKAIRDIYDSYDEYDFDGPIAREADKIEDMYEPLLDDLSEGVWPNGHPDDRWELVF